MRSFIAVLRMFRDAPQVSDNDIGYQGFRMLAGTLLILHTLLILQQK
jgi:hypothetical protein